MSKSNKSNLHAGSTIVTHLRVIDGGLPATGGTEDSPGRLGPGIKRYDAALAETVEQAEAHARVAVQLVAPAIAIGRTSRVDLMRMIAATDVADAVQTHSVFSEAVTAMGAMFELLRTAELRLRVAINTVARDNFEPEHQ
jgi:hypothetical protein